MSDWKSVLSAVAPTLAGMLAGPLAGAAVSALSTSLLGRPDGRESDIATAVLSGTPDILEKIVTAEKTFKLEMEKLNVDFERIAQEDRKSAREREVGTQDPTTRRLAYFYTAGYFGALWTVWQYGMPAEMKDILIGLLGVLTAAQAAIMQYYFGSSRGSDKKTDVMSRMAK